MDAFMDALGTLTGITSSMGSSWEPEASRVGFAVSFSWEEWNPNEPGERQDVGGYLIVDLARGFAKIQQGRKSLGSVRFRSTANMTDQELLHSLAVALKPLINKIHARFDHDDTPSLGEPPWAHYASGLRGEIVKLAHDVPEMRKHLVPLLKQEKK